MEDVDKVYTSINEDSLSDSDLDFIDTLNEDDELSLDSEEDESLLEEITDTQDNLEIINDYTEPNEEENIDKDEPDILETKASTTPMVPVYDADIPQEDMVMSDPIEQGDTVTS